MGGRFELWVLSAVLAACSSPKDKKPSAFAEIASSSPAVRPAAAPSAAPVSPEKPTARRPKDAADVLLTPEKRKRVEAFAPQGAGFVSSAELEEQLWKLGLRRGKDSAAAAAFDRLAKGKWVLFTGNIGNPTADGFELPIRYAPREMEDPMGLTSVWLPVRFSKIEGYDGKQYRAGEFAVVLARYGGEQKASEGYDLVLLEKWFGPG